MQPVPLELHDAHEPGASVPGLADWQSAIRQAGSLRYNVPVHGKHLVRAVLRGERVPRVPVGPLAVHFCAGGAGYTLRQYTTDAGALADSVIRYYERFRPDAVWVSADTWVSAEAMGARVGSVDDDQPLGGVGEPLIRTASDIGRIGRPDVGTQGRYPLMLEALRRVVGALGRDVFVVGCFDQYPFSLAAALMGIGELMVKVVDDPPFVQALMERCAEYAVAYGRAMAEAGADLLSGGDSPAGLIGPRLYEELALPFEQQVIRGLRDLVRTPVSLHICGRATPLLGRMVASGADVIEVDQQVDLGEACRVVGSAVTLWGNLDPVGVLAQGTPARVAEAVRNAHAQVAAAGHGRWVLSSGCTLAVGTPAANLEALIGRAGAGVGAMGGEETRL
jgi:MtaA/CmuA family methyltransferase